MWQLMMEKYGNFWIKNFFHDSKLRKKTFQLEKSKENWKNWKTLKNSIFSQFSLSFHENQWAEDKNKENVKPRT